MQTPTTYMQQDSQAIMMQPLLKMDGSSRHSPMYIAQHQSQLRDGPDANQQIIANQESPQSQGEKTRIVHSVIKAKPGMDGDEAMENEHMHVASSQLLLSGVEHQ
jgi:hypothetical protein